MSDKKLYLVDASGYIFRAYYAIRPLSNSKGLPTNALFGFTSMLTKLLKEEKPDLIGIVFDVARKTFRNEKYPEYKANRSEPPPDLVPQFPYFRKIVKALNLPVLELPNYEADDVIGTIAKKFERKGWQTVIVTGDKDLMQLVDEKIVIFDSMKEKWIREPEVMEKFGVTPSQVIDVLALAGDSSDNIPGVPGIGDKTAIKLIQEYGSLEKVLANARSVKGKMGEKLVQFADQARLCRELATIVTDVPIEYDLDDFKIKAPDVAASRELFSELEFKNFLKEYGEGKEDEPLLSDTPVPKEVVLGNYLLDPDKRSVPIDDFDVLKKRLEEEGLLALFTDLEMPLAAVLEKMEKNGVKVDVAKLKKSSEEYGIRLAEIEKEVHQKAGGPFNLNSPKQLAQVLFEKLKLPVIRKTKTGYSTDVEVLTELASKHEVPKLLLEYRSLSKLKSTYLDALPALVEPKTGRIHTSFNQTVAATGRLSSTTPNLQNIPIRTEEGKKIREAFIAEKGNLILSADYSQIELRILAHLSGDKILLEAFQNDQDIHRATAAAVFGVKESEVTDAQRSVGKTVNFAVLYGQGAFSLSQQLEIPVPEAENYIRNYFGRHKSVAALKDKILFEATATKMIRTLFGRLRRFPEIDSANKNIRAMAERTAFNAVFQGTAADLIKKAMITIQNRIEKEFPRAKMLIQVHDELVFEAPEEQMVEFSKMVKQEMGGVAELKVPLKVDTGIGPNWAKAH
jgi:DNA polymerase I-like protein with 3'-5' exonuclease and polymerase domains/5'-3' exonuclease